MARQFERLSAVGSACAHSFNNGNYWINAFFFLWSFGVIFGCIYYVTGSLALVIGLHAAWDFDAMFLFRVSTSNDCYLFRLESVPGGPGRWLPNDNLFLILLMAAVLLWMVRHTSRPGFRSPLLPNSL